MANERLPEAYAQAIFEQATQSWLAPLKEFADCIKPSDLQELDQPGVPFEKKQEVLQRVLPSNAPNEVRNFLSLLASKNEMHLMPTILSALDRYSQRGPLRPIARVTSTIHLTDADRRELEEKIRGRFGDEMDFEYVIDPAILGGVIVRVGDKVIDGSVSGKLAALRDKLK